MTATDHDNDAGVDRSSEEVSNERGVERTGDVAAVEQRPRDSSGDEQSGRCCATRRRFLQTAGVGIIPVAGVGSTGTTPASGSRGGESAATGHDAVESTTGSVPGETDTGTEPIAVAEPDQEGDYTPTPTEYDATEAPPPDDGGGMVTQETLILGGTGGLLALLGGYALVRRFGGDDSSPQPGGRASSLSGSHERASDTPQPEEGTGSGAATATTDGEPSADTTSPGDDTATDDPGSDPIEEAETSLTGAGRASGASRVPTEIPTAPELSLSYEDITKEAPIGSGGQADVYRGTVPAPTGELTVAVKEPRMGDMRHGEALERLVLEEAEMWQKLDGHDHVVGVVDVGSQPLPWLVMEYMDAGHLGDRAGEMDVRQGLWSALVTTRAVRHAHRRGVAHLDLKPQNILFRSVGGAWDVPKVADWGLSKQLLEHSRSVEGMSPHYAAPEQFEESYGATDDVTDVFQLGAVFYVLFTGRAPFEGRPVQVMNKMLNERPTPPSEIADVPRELDDIILTAMATEKNDRYESVLYLRDDLQELFESM